MTRVMSNSAWVTPRYTKDEVDWIAVYDATTETCSYLPSSEWDGQVMVNLRLAPTANGQVKGVRFAGDFTQLVGDPRVGRSGPAQPAPLPLILPPE